MAKLDTASVLITTVTMLTVELLVGGCQDVSIDVTKTNRLDWLGKYLRPFVLRLLEL